MLSAIKLFFDANKWAGWLAGVLLVIGALAWMRHDAYTDGIAHRDSQIAEANQKLRDRVTKAETSADKVVLANEIVNNEKLQDELERLDEAEVNGTSPFDVLYPVSVH